MLNVVVWELPVSQMKPSATVPVVVTGGGAAAVWASRSARSVMTGPFDCSGPAGVLSPRTMDRPQISVVIPLFNEEDNVQPLLDELFAELSKLGRTFEVICVDDGSRDGTFNELSHYAARQPELRVIRFRLNFGQTAAMSAGIEAAR